ncbi:MAG: zinc-binding alcohol dehydrogenase [Planctomycetes bacterium]|nr:zinc-binding alcohol dehydrogenase [Planctomycetota bacterium]
MTTATSTTIRAVAFTAAQRAELVELPGDPAPLAANEVEGPTLASLTSPGTELNWQYLGANFPAYPGYACIFEVQRAGAEVTAVKPGDRVFTMGPHRSWQRVPVTYAVKMPDGLDPRVAVFSRLMGVSMSTLTTTLARPPANVLVTGLGPVGNLAAQIFQSCGYSVTAADPVESRRQLASKLGLKSVVANVPPTDPLAKKISLHAECSGHEQAVLDGLKLVAKRGEVVMIGVPWKKRTDLSAFDILHAVFHRYATLRSGWEWEVPIEPAEFRMGSMLGSFAAAMRWLAEGRVRVDGLYLAVPPRDPQPIYQGLLHQTLSHPAAVFDWSAL